MKRILTFIIALLISALGLNAQNFDVIDPELQAILNQKSNDLISINIVMESRHDVNDLDVKFTNIKDKDEKRKSVIAKLKKHSSENQNKVMAYLQAEEGNNVTDLKSHWLVNTISCTASRDVIYKTSELSGISLIAHNGKEKLIGDYKPMKAQKQRGLIQNVTTVGADQVWAEGYTGKDVIVAVLDSGVNSEHADLQDHLWDGGSEYPDHGWNFIDNNSNTDDHNGHGTHCAGTISGDGTSGTQTGMAPDATLMCVKVLDDDGRGTLDAFVSGVEFAVENGADILSISLGWTYPNSYVSEIMREMFENVVYAGVVASVAAGNERAGIDTIPIPYNINAPGNCPPPWLHPDQQANAGGLSAVVAVGAVDYYDEPAYFSSEGPVTWQGSQWHDYILNSGVEIDENWLHYDNGIFETSIGGPESFYWGVMFPAAILQQHSGDMLSKIAVYDYIADTLELLVYYGGDYAPEVLAHTQTFELTGSNSVVEIDMTSSLPIDRNENLWIVLSTNNGINHPAAACSNTGNPNGRWLSIDGTTWGDLSEQGLSCTWMIRAYMSDENGTAITELKSIDDYEYKSSKGKLSALKADSKRAGAASNDSDFGLIRPDVSAPGVDILSAAYDDNYGHYSFSGTSMATPCVAGVMALMLDKNPNLTPADICRILETTATPLDYKKSNRTGSGRINAYEACKLIEEENEEMPSAPTNLVAEAISSSDIQLSWDAVEKAEYYNIYHGNVILGNTTETICKIIKLNYGTYCFTATAVNEMGESGHSNKACATLSEDNENPTDTIAPTPDPEIIDAPENLIATPTSTSSISLTWDEVKEADSYNIYRDGKLLKNVEMNSYIDKELTENKQYCYTVTTVVNGEESAMSAEACAKTLELSLEAPENFEANAKSCSSILLTWNEAENAESYNIYQDDKLIDDTDETEYLVEDLVADTKYCFYVTAVNGSKESDESDKDCDITDKKNEESIEEISSSLLLYPNPVKDELIIATELRVEEIAIHDIYGRTMSLCCRDASNASTSTMDTFNVSVQDLENGIYFINIKTDNGNIVRRFIKN